jgi:hypothetical protein
VGAHIDTNGKFQSVKYPMCPAGKVPLSVNDVSAQDLLWEYAQRRRSIDSEFSDDLEHALLAVGCVRPVVFTGKTVDDFIKFMHDNCQQY